MSPEELRFSADRLSELDRLIVRSFIEWDPKALELLVAEFSDTKKAVQAYLIKNPSVTLPGEKAAAARSILSKIASGDQLPGERALTGQIVDCDLDNDDLEEIGAQELYSWISHNEYANGLFKAGALIANCDSLPSTLKALLGEVRQCYALQQYNAVCSLCRAILDVAVRDVATQHGVLREDKENVVQLTRHKHETLYDLINALTHHALFSHLREPLHSIRRSTNPIVHGGRTAAEVSAAATLRATLNVVHRLYEVVDRA